MPRKTVKSLRALVRCWLPALVAALVFVALPRDALALLPGACFMTPTPLAGQPNPVPVGANPRAIAVGDFNNDGNLDFVTANRNSTTVSVRLGDGLGHYRAVGTGDIVVGQTPESVAVGDFNKDGKLDIVATTSGDQYVNLVFGDGTGRFSPATGLAMGAAPGGVAVGDFNGDGNLDFAVTTPSANPFAAKVVVYRGDGRGGAAPAGSYGVGADATVLATGDLNGDGRTDIAVASVATDNVSIWISNGDSFESRFPVSVRQDPNAIVLVDMNRDGVLDIVTNNYGANSVSIRYGNGDGTFASATARDVAYGVSGFRHTSVATLDFNRDGSVDLAGPGEGTTQMDFLASDGAGSFSQPTQRVINMGTVGATSVVVGDVNRDGLPDLLVAAYFDDGRGGVYSNVSILLNCQPNEAPVVTVPGSQVVVEGGTLTFAAATSNAISVADPDAYASPMQVNLAAGDGTLSLGRTTGLTFSAGDGVNDPGMTFTGTLPNVNAALAGLTYTPYGGFAGVTTLTLVVDDRGGVGVGGVKSDDGSIGIVVTPRTGGPSATNDTYTLPIQTTLTMAAPGVLANDGNPSGGAMTAVLASTAQHGDLVLNPNGSFSYTPRAGYVGADSFSYRVSQSGRQSGVATVTLTVAPTQCVPRPRVRPTPVVGGGRLDVRVEATPLNTQANNPLQSLTLGTLQNAKVTLNGQVLSSGQRYTPPPGTVSVDFTVERITPGQPTTVPFTVVDGCGSWPTFVGGGTGAGF